MNKTQSRPFPLIINIVNNTEKQLHVLLLVLRSERHAPRKKGDKDNDNFWGGFGMYMMNLAPKLAALKLALLAAFLVLGIIVGLVAAAVSAKLYLIAIVSVVLQAIKNKVSYGHMDH